MRARLLQEPQNKRAAVSRRGVSVKLLTIVLFAVSIITVLLSFYEAERTRTHAQQLYEIERERQKCDDAIQLLMDGSDYLTAQVQQYVITADSRYMESYWVEVDQTRSRDKAIQSILESSVTGAESDMAIAGKAESDRLIDGEVWAMRIVAESVGMEEARMPAQVAACRLSPEDAALTDQQKQQAAINYIFGPKYSLAKADIRGNVVSFRNQITRRFSDEAMEALGTTKSTLWYTETLIFAVMLITFGTLAVYMAMVVAPISRYSREISKADQEHPALLKEQGAAEIKTFARTFNALYEQVKLNTERLRRLGYMDYLTDIPNRARITEYVEGAINAGEDGMGLLIVDVDNFKHYNDTYGHAVGDVTLVQIAKAVSAALKEEGIAGRICGEEFVVVVRNATEEILSKTADRILQNVRGISAQDISLPVDPGYGVTVSIGGAMWVADGSASFVSLLAKADQALYVAKESGKNRFCMNGETPARQESEETLERRAHRR